MNPPLAVIKMLHVIIISFHVNLLYSCMLTSYRIDVDPHAGLWRHPEIQKSCKKYTAQHTVAVSHVHRWSTGAESHPWTESSFSTNLNGGTLADERTFRSGMNMSGHSYCRWVQLWTKLYEVTSELVAARGWQTVVDEGLQLRQWANIPILDVHVRPQCSQLKVPTVDFCALVGSFLRARRSSMLAMRWLSNWSSIAMADTARVVPLFGGRGYGS